MHAIDLSGKKALITGGAGGIGRECAVLLAEAGAQVAVVDINLAGAQETAALCPGAIAIACDLGDAASVTAMAQEALARLGTVHILVNCGGLIAYQRGVTMLSVEQWDKVLDVNLRGTFLVCHELLEAMKKNGWGKIINFASMAARVGGLEVGIHYTASKAGLIGATKSLAREGGPYGICANAIAPGMITTAPVRQQIAGREESYLAQIPLRRLGEARDVANVVLFLSSPLSDYINGATIDINGGQYMA
jgi:NAD(P)-dependent dehydrogenase (short-subunit alcohol dehydrogenase family)